MASLSLTEDVTRAEQLLRAGRLDEMESVCRAILTTAPQTADIHRFLGLAAYARSRWTEAEQHVRRALRWAPQDAVAHDNLSLVLLALNRPGEAETAARQARALQPTLANAAHNLGLALQRQGRFVAAWMALQDALELEPNNADTWNNLAAVLEQMDRHAEAIQALERALQLRPDFSLARENLRRLQQAQPAEAAPVAEQNNHGVALLAQGRHAEAEAVFRRALLGAPELPELWFNLAKSLQGQQQLPAAEQAYQRAVSLRPDWALAHLQLGFVYFAQRRLSDAETAFRRSLEVAATPRDRLDALNSLAANILNYEGRIDEARAAYLQALALGIEHANCHSNMLLNEQYAPGATLAGLAEVHAGWEQRYAAPLRSTWRPFAQAPDPERPLRLGIVSGDFFYHPVGIFLAPVLERLDRAKFFTVCYDNYEKTDDLTRRLMQAAGLWRKVHALDDDALAQRIRDDGIDLLFDLAGHTGRNRLLTFARRPAPVQLTWMGYVGTTGLSAIDYLIADRFQVPPGGEDHYREKVLRLPDGYLCYEPPDYAPPVGPLPAQSAGHVTFGCFNNTAKINPEVVALWAQILSRVPGSRLVVKYHWLNDADLRRRLTDLFAAESIPAERLELLGSTSHAEQLQQYNRIDVALDPFPYSGGLTTCEACWMGVPVLTCPGERFASRHSLSHLSNIGLKETIVSDQAEYVARAVRLAGDLPHLAELRAGLRSRMARAPLCDCDRFTEHLAAAWRQVWRTWCAGQA
jgi:predicted O-linked N-acetylglucosamine transferase (SPINDLY family)